MRIYLAGPFFNDTERQNICKARDILRGRGFDVFVPMEHKIKDDDKLPNDIWGQLVFEMDRDEIYNCDIIVALYYGLYSDSGTAWEIGFSFSLNKKIIIVHCQPDNPQSLMIVNGSTININGISNLLTFNFDDMIEDKKFIKDQK